MKEISIALFRGAKREMQWVVINHRTGEHKVESCAHAACITARRWFKDNEDIKSGEWIRFSERN
jgi:hypothetical protein